jgi:hypothetical protein
MDFFSSLLDFAGSIRLPERVVSIVLQRFRLRSLSSRLTIAAAIGLLIAQLGIATHALHDDPGRVDSVCAFCSVGAHLASPQSCGDPLVIMPFGDERPIVAHVPAIDRRPVANTRARAPPSTAHNA